MVMPSFSGSFSGKASGQTIVYPNDVPNHELHLNKINGTQKSTDKSWNNAEITYWSTLDLVSGNGSQRGYFLNVHEDGDSDSGSFEGKVTTTAKEVTLEGTWKYSGGTGKLKGLTGGGTYKGRLTSPTQVEIAWDGAYQLVSKAAR
jgi:hypothetical protein